MILGNHLRCSLMSAGRLCLLDAFTGGLVAFEMRHQLRISSKVNQRRDAYRHNNNKLIEVLQRVF